MALQSLCVENTDDISVGTPVVPTHCSTSDDHITKLLLKIKKILRAHHVIAILPNQLDAKVLTADQTFLQHVPCSTALFQHLNQLHPQQILDEKHPQYLQYRVYIEQYFGAVNRLVSFAVHDADSNGVAHICVFDQNHQTFDTDFTALAFELCEDYVKQVGLEQQHKELLQTHEQIVALNFSQTKFLQIIAHDLRAPFHGILGFSEVLADELESLDASSVKNIASYLNDTAKATYHLLENLLNWAMAEGGRFVYHPVRFDLKEASQTVSNVLSSLAYSKHIELIDAIPEKTYVYADLNMVTSILQNLVSNALKFTQQDGSGKVRISVKKIEQCIELSISDTGLGMNEIQKNTIFEPKIKTTLKGTNGEKGTGLGLVLCKRFVDLNQGQITVQSEEGCGTTFIVQLPTQQTSTFEAQSNTLTEV
ncbi:sensor histidine kinase [Acinetobacter rathckeae]|uniref:sensor histidine kinase n=1 Tax=Acinetobacter rathckeae TaxID=2605272 RepID=UPI0018A2DC5D|nr:HAMP domain-containing sensor histidine kinase [Acinetobacter rathckeae]MBF7687783.1 HAMP domain-containing histidine kinase [Acinetobacter rathckeae]MBF7687994.1 HAMP domain-containing histidine kinase [Acinetobacter rathckeae]MBF7695952.1 HAMP domain-containing histidine kinase [Acinetobacter rathckeae]